MPGGMDMVVAKCLGHIPKTENLITCKASDSFAEVYKSFLHKAVHRILVVDGSGKLHGVVSRSNVLRMLVETPKTPAQT
jgi:CBS domain-containing protein